VSKVSTPQKSYVYNGLIKILIILYYIYWWRRDNQFDDHWCHKYWI